MIDKVSIIMQVLLEYASFKITTTLHQLENYVL